MIQAATIEISCRVFCFTDGLKVMIFFHYRKIRITVDQTLARSEANFSHEANHKPFICHYCESINLHHLLKGLAPPASFLPFMTLPHLLLMKRSGLHLSASRGKTLHCSHIRSGLSLTGYSRSLRLWFPDTLQAVGILEFYFTRFPLKRLGMPKENPFKLLRFSVT